MVLSCFNFLFKRVKSCALILPQTVSGVSTVMTWHLRAPRGMGTCTMKKPQNFNALGLKLMAEDAILDKSWGDSPRNVFYRCAVKHNFILHVKSKNNFPALPPLNNLLCAMATWSKQIHMASHALILENPLRRKSFIHSIPKGFLLNYRRSVKCEIGES